MKVREVISAYAPDLPGCVATGRTVDEVKQRMREAIQLHLQGLKEEGLPIPSANASAEYIVVTTPRLNVEVKEITALKVEKSKRPRTKQD